MAVNYGSKRVVTGAHYGLRDWMVQRVTAVLMALFTVVLLAQVIFTSGPIGYETWAGIFAAQWMKFLTFAVVIVLGAMSLLLVYADIVKPVSLFG